MNYITMMTVQAKSNNKFFISRVIFTAYSVELFGTFQFRNDGLGYTMS